jgi:hypothetical protein
MVAMRISSTLVVRVLASSSLYEGITRRRGAMGLSRSWQVAQSMRQLFGLAGQAEGDQGGERREP